MDRPAIGVRRRLSNGSEKHETPILTRLAAEDEHAEISRIARLDAERREADRQAGRGFDFDLQRAESCGVSSAHRPALRLPATRILEHRGHNRTQEAWPPRLGTGKRWRRRFMRWRSTCATPDDRLCAGIDLAQEQPLHDLSDVPFFEPFALIYLRNVPETLQRQGSEHKSSTPSELSC